MRASPTLPGRTAKNHSRKVCCISCSSPSPKVASTAPHGACPRVPFLRLDVPSECVALHLAKLGLNWRGTGVAECAADARRAAARGEQAAIKVRLINMTNVTRSPVLSQVDLFGADALGA